MSRQIAIAKRVIRIGRIVDPLAAHDTLAKLEGTDANPTPSASLPGVGADQCPVVICVVTLHKHLSHDYPQNRERSHERLSDFRDRAAPNRAGAIIYISEPSTED